MMFRSAKIAMFAVAAMLFIRTHSVAAAAEDYEPQPPESLRPMLKITWTRGPDLPQGLQDNDGGVIGNHLIAVGGFCSGSKEDNEKKPGRYPRGFLKKVMALDITAKDAQWEFLPDLPGEARQGLFAIVIDQKLYLWGGFNYDPPYTYANGFALAQQAGAWKWENLPSLPWKLTSAGACAVGSKIYVFGGADYDGEIGFHTQTNRDKKLPRLGARLLMIDTAKLRDGWKELPQCPGTPRFVHATQAVNGKIYVIGGATGPQNRTIVDNWMFDPATNAWSRLRDTPVSTGNFPKSSNLVYDNRYIILPGGHQYAEVANPDGTVRPKYGVASTKNPKSGLHNDVFVYDTQANLFGTADKLPIDNNLPMTVVHGNTIYLLGGETGGWVVEGEYYGHHPDLLLKGTIQNLSPSAPKE